MRAVAATPREALADKIPLTNLDRPSAPAELAADEDQASASMTLDSIHDFATKLTQPGAREALERYVEWQVAQREATDMDAEALAELAGRVPDFAPVSINLDLTTACNYQCDHCVDLDILNTGIRFDHDKLISSLGLMAERGLKSVIVIGGGEPL